MSSLSSRARWTSTVAVTFVAGLLFASGMNWTRLGLAQPQPSPLDPRDLRPVTDVSNAFVAIADRVTPAVVSIQVESRMRTPNGMQIPRGMVPPGWDDYFKAPSRPMVEEASGSGFIVSQDGYILTNNHVVTEADHNTVADKITVQLLDHRHFTAHVVGHDPTTDIAVIKIDGKNFPTIQLGDDRQTRVGEWVLAVGNPLGLDFTVTAGIVSAKGRSLPGLLGDRYAVSDLLQTDAAINPGNSGGPLVDMHGQVIGVNSAIASQTGYYSGYGFAIPITLAKRAMDDIIAHGRVRFGVLGVAIGEVDAEAAGVAGLKDIRGALVEAFVPDNDHNPAKDAGLQINDVIIGADGQPVDRVSTLQRIIRNHAPGETIHIEAMRYGRKMSFDVRLAERPSDGTLASAVNAGGVSQSTGVAESKLGVRFGPLPATASRTAGVPAHGVVVTDVEPLGPAHDRLYPNDVITEILYPGPRRPVQSVADLEDALRRLKTGAYLSLNVVAMGNQGPVSRVVNLQVGS